MLKEKDPFGKQETTTNFGGSFTLQNSHIPWRKHFILER